MSITRDAEFPAEIAQLTQAFNHCADGFPANAVLNAALQMLGATIGFLAKSKGASLEEAMSYTNHVSRSLQVVVTENWDRAPQPTDVPVKLG